MSALHQARAYVASQPPAVSGAKGHNATFRVACCLVGLGLSDAETLALLREFNARCQPPWTEKELLHKLQDARRKVRVVRRPLAPKPVRLSWKPEWFSARPRIESDPAAVPVPSPPGPPPVVEVKRDLLDAAQPIGQLDLGLERDLRESPFWG